MNVKPLYDEKKVSIEEYLYDMGINDAEEYLYPTNKYMEQTSYYNNIDKAIEIFYKHLLDKSKVYIIVDGDCDGYTSASMLYQYMKILEPKWDIKVGIHNGKERGLSDLTLFQDIFDKKCNLVIIPDAGTNDKEQIKELVNNNIDVIVLDHHDIEISCSQGVIVNNQQGKADKYGSGCAVTYMFIKAFDNHIGAKFSNQFIDLVGLSIISDSMNIISQQNRKYLYYGILYPNRINNPLIKELIAQSQLSDKNDYTQKDIAFGIVPCINAVCRCDNMELKQKMFLAFINSNKINISEIAKEMKAQHTKQQKIVKNFVDEHLDYIENNNDKSIFVYVNNDVPRNYSGLIAMKICDIINKPTIIMYDNGIEMMGSCRSKIPIKEQINKLDYVFARGHSMAFGIGMASEDFYRDFIFDIDALVVPSEPCETVFQSWSIKSLPKRLFGLYEPYRALWGQGLLEPIFHIYNINVKKDDVKIIGKNGNTIKIKNNDITLIKFFCSEVDKEKFLCYNKYQLEVIGFLDINEWDGNKYPQIIFDKYEIKPQEKKLLEDLF